MVYTVIYTDRQVLTLSLSNREVQTWKALRKLADENPASVIIVYSALHCTRRNNGRHYQNYFAGYSLSLIHI